MFYICPEIKFIMTERQILHTRFLEFFNELEEQGRVCRKSTSKPFKKLAETLEIHTNLLSDYLVSKRKISFLQAYHFCNYFEISLETMFQEMPNYIERVNDEGGYNICSEQNVVGGSAVSDGLIDSYELYKNKLGKGLIKTKVINDSMMPYFSHGDTIELRELSSILDIKNGHPYVIETINDGLRVKNLFKRIDEDCLWLISDNPKYKTDPFLVSNIRKIYEIISPTTNLTKHKTTQIENIKIKLGESISKGKGLDILNILLSFYKFQNNELIGYKSQWQRVLKQRNLDEIETKEYNQNISRIERGLLDFIKEIKETDLLEIIF